MTRIQGDDQSHQTNNTAQLIMRGQLRQTPTGALRVEEDVIAEGFIVRDNGNGDSDDDVHDFLHDDPSEMTWGRRIALSLMNKTWYNPRAGEDTIDESFKDAQMDIPFESNDEPSDNMFARTTTTKPNLRKAWTYFEHVALDRFVVEQKENTQKKNICWRIIRKFQKGDKKFERAEPGENDVKTRLYSPIFTPHKQLGDFGLGIGLYFSTLRAIAFITFLLGLVSSYNIRYFASDSYMPDNSRDFVANALIQGSAVCTNTRKEHILGILVRCFPSQSILSFPRHSLGTLPRLPVRIFQ